MNTLKIKIADEPRILVSAIRHPFQVILSFEGTTETISGIIRGEDFVYSTSNISTFNNVLSLLTKNKINFSVDYSL